MGFILITRHQQKDYKSDYMPVYEQKHKKGITCLKDGTQKQFI